MDFGERKIGFQEAERRYAELKQKHDAGTIGDEEFESRLREMMVQEEGGRWWVKSRRSGEWHYYDGSGWVPGMPPGYQPSRSSSAEQTDRGGRVGSRLLMGGAAVLVLALIAAVGWSQLQQASAPQSPPLEGNAAEITGQQETQAQTAQVPDVLGKAPGEARDIIGANGFEVKIKPDKWSSEWPDGVVVTEQSPGEGEAEKGSTVTVTLDYPDGQKPQDQQNQQEQPSQQNQQDYQQNQQDQSGY